MRPALSLCCALIIAACARAEARPLVGGQETKAATTVPAPGRDPRVPRADLARINGKPEARLWILVVSDFQCPYCKEYHDKTSRLVQKEFVDAGIARVAYINYPLKVHQNAMPAAEAAMCGGAQDKFWPFHDRLFATQARWAGLARPQPFFEGLARELKLNLEIYRKCVADHVMVPMIQADYQRGSKSGVSSTPTFIIGNVVIPGNAPIDVFRTAVRESLAGKM